MSFKKICSEPPPSIAVSIELNSFGWKKTHRRTFAFILGKVASLYAMFGLHRLNAQGELFMDLVKAAGGLNGSPCVDVGCSFGLRRLMWNC
jgi:hypothetical protein